MKRQGLYNIFKKNILQFFFVKYHRQSNICEIINAIFVFTECHHSQISSLKCPYAIPPLGPHSILQTHGPLGAKVSL